MKKKIIPLLLIMFILPGCWGYYNMSDLSLIQSMSVDYNSNDEFEIITESILPNIKSNDNTSTSHMNYSKGNSLYEAARNLATCSEGKKNFYPFIKVVIIGDYLAKKGIKSVVDFFYRDPKRRSTVYFIISKETGASILDPKHTAISNISSGVDNIIKLVELTGYGVDKKLYDFINDSSGLSGIAFLNMFSLEKNKGSVYSQKESSKTSEDSELTLIGTGVFYNYKLIGHLSKNETLHVNMLSENIKETVIVMDANKDNATSITLKLLDIESKLNPKINKGSYDMNAVIATNANIVEYSKETPLINLDIKELEDACSNYISEEILNTFNKAKNEFCVDLFKFGNKFSKKYPYLNELSSEKWNEIFKEKVTLNLKVKVNITTSDNAINSLD